MFKTADQKFEELGFTKTLDKNNKVTYVNKDIMLDEETGRQYDRVISLIFDHDYGECIIHANKRYFDSNGKFYSILPLSTDEILAIGKKVKEMDRRES